MMFCLGCGSEITIRAEFCPVCGQRIGEPPRPVSASPAASSARNALGSHAPAPPLPPSSPWRTPPSQPASGYTSGYAGGYTSSGANDGYGDSYAHGGAPPAPAASAPDASDTAPRISAMRPPEQSGPLAGMGGIRWGDLDGLAFPRDTSGRFVLAAAAALVVGLFLPWVSYGALSITPDHLGRFTLATIAAAIVAAATTFWGPRRRGRLAAVAPFGLGALLLGAGLLYADQYLSLPPQENITLGVGFYLFLLSAAALVIAGYRLLMEALTVQQAPGVVTLPAPAVDPTYLARPAAFVDPQAASSSTPLAGASAGFGTPAPLSATRQATPPGQSPQASPSGAPLLPGDPRWDEAATPPPVVRRPAYGGGWGRGGVSRR